MPLLVDMNGQVEIFNGSSAQVSMAAKNGYDRSDLRVDCDSALTPQQRLSVNMHQLLRLSQASRGAGSKDRNQQVIRHSKPSHRAARQSIDLPLVITKPARAS